VGRLALAPEGLYPFLMRVVAIVLFVAAAIVGALALSLAIALGREYGIDTFWLSLAWAGLFTLVPLVPGILLFRRSNKRARDGNRPVNEVPVEQTSRP
jgi:hypothetical protein